MKIDVSKLVITSVIAGFFASQVVKADEAASTATEEKPAAEAGKDHCKTKDHCKGKDEKDHAKKDHHKKPHKKEKAGEAKPE